MGTPSVTPEPQTIQLSGAGGIRNIGPHYELLSQALSAGADIALDIGDVEDADLTFIQLIIAARHSAQARGLSLTLSSPAPEPVLQTLERGGFIGPEPDDRRQFWLAQ
jgi:anti-anti-sigma regulatory factor